MPYFNIRDLAGMVWSLTSSDPEIVSAWLLEQARRAVTLNSMYGPLMLTVNPLVLDPVNGVFDWPVSGVKSNIEYQIEAGQLLKLIRLMEQFRVKQTIGEDNRMSGAEWCDFANHPFKAGAEGVIRTSRKVGKGDEVDEHVICPECAAEIGLNPEYKAPEESPFQRRAIIKGAIENGK